MKTKSLFGLVSPLLILKFQDLSTALKICKRLTFNGVARLTYI